MCGDMPAVFMGQLSQALCQGHKRMGHTSQFFTRSVRSLAISLALALAVAPASVGEAAKGGDKEKAAKGAKPKKPGKALSKEALFNRIAPATVLIVIQQADGFSIGSGAVIDKTGLIITNAHVVAASTGTVQVYMFNPREKSLETNLKDFLKSHTPLNGRVTKRGKDLDLALVRLPEMSSQYPTVDLGDSEGLRIGQDVIAIGNPHGLTWTFTSGTISAIRKDALQTETPINPGNSGGPLVDMFGRVVGINTFIRKESQGLGFAIPVNVVREFVAQFGEKRDTEGPAEPSGPSLSKNPVPLAALTLNQDLGKLRELNAQRSNKQTEGTVGRDLVAAELVRQRMIKGDLTVAQMLPQMLDVLKLMAVHNQASDDSSAQKSAFHQQIEKTAEHLKQIFQVSK